MNLVVCMQCDLNMGSMVWLSLICNLLVICVNNKCSGSA